MATLLNPSMEVLTDDQGLVGLEHEPNHPGDNQTYDEDDEFDFNIGGEDDLDPNAENYSTNGSFTNVAGHNGLGDDTSFNYEATEQENHTDTVVAPEEDHQYNGEVNDETLELNVDAPEAPEAPGNANEVDDSDEIEQVGNQYGMEDVVQVHTEEDAEEDIEEEVYYRGTGEEFEGFSNSTQPQPDHGHECVETATSVDNVSGDDELDTAGLEVAVPEDPFSGSKSAIVETREIEAVEVLDEDDVTTFGLEADEAADGEVLEEHTQYVDGEVGGGEPSYEDGDQEELSSHKDSIVDPADEAQDQESWDREEHDVEGSDTRPKVTISYQSHEYSLFAESSDQDPDYYFLADLDSLHQPLSQLLANIRDVISDEITPSQEVSLRVNGLGFEFAESTTKDFLDETTLAHIIEINKQLIANEGGSPSPILHCYLALRPSCLHRFSELSKAADEGKGLSDIAMFYDDASTDESAEDHEDHDFSQDIISDSPSLEEAVDHDDTTGKNDGSNDTEQYHNPFRTTEEQFQTIDDVMIPNTAEDELSEREDLSVEALGGGSSEFEKANVFESVSGDIDEGFETDTVEAPDYGRDPSGQNESTYDQPTAEAVEVADVEQHAEMQTDSAKEDYGNINGETSILSPRITCGKVDLCLCFECLRPHIVGWGDYCSLVLLPETHTLSHTTVHTDDGDPVVFNFTMSSIADINDQEIVVDPADNNNGNDDDYLDLGNDEGNDGTYARPIDSVVTIGDEADGSSAPLGISPQASQHSSATATLDGNDHGAENVVPVNQDPTDSRDPQNEIESDTSNGEIDEIDWNHDEEGDLDDANQNPAALSPSSPSAKRNREEDENVDGMGDENGA